VAEQLLVNEPRLGADDRRLNDLSVVLRIEIALAHTLTAMGERVDEGGIAEGLLKNLFHP